MSLTEILRETLKREYGIESDADLIRAVDHQPGLDIGIFASPCGTTEKCRNMRIKCVQIGAVRYAEAQRGYDAIGGEILVFPSALFAGYKMLFPDEYLLYEEKEGEDA